MVGRCPGTLLVHLIRVGVGIGGGIVENLWSRYAAPLPPAAFSQPPSDIRSGSGNSEGRRWLVEGRVGGVRAGWSTVVTLLYCPTLFRVLPSLISPPIISSK